MRRLALIAAALVTAALAAPLGNVAHAAAAADPVRQDLPWSTPGPGGSHLTRVSCWATGACVAVGSISSQTSEPAAFTLADGSWTSLVLPVPDGVPFGTMIAVDCTGPDFCVGLGRSYGTQGYPNGTFVETLSGSTWTAKLLSAGADAKTFLEAVSCPAEGTCIAVGSVGDHAVAATLSGSEWTTTTPPVSKTTDSDLADVDCPTVAACVAVGGMFSGDALVETLSAGTWSDTIPPPTNNTIENSLSSVSCVDIAHCTSVGRYQKASEDYEPMADTLSDGSWTSTPIPDPTDGFDQTDPISVRCTSAASCIAVAGGAFGSFADGFATGTWSGSRLPSVANTYNTAMNAIDCTGEGECLAVGAAQGTRYTQAISETLAAGSWAAAGVPAVVPPNSSMRGISCRSQDECIAVGDFRNSDDRGGAFTETLDGEQWTGAAVDPNSIDVRFTGISCPSVDRCLALYWTYDGVYADQLSNGSWTVSNVLATTSIGTISAPSCPTADTCRFVIRYKAANGSSRFVAETLSGGNWSAEPLPTPANMQYGPSI